MELNINGHTLRYDLTCGACPEQYNVYLDGLQIGYLRLRHGNFRADYKYCGGETVYFARPKGDGIFDDNERLDYLRKAGKSLLQHHQLQLDIASYLASCEDK